MLSLVPEKADPHRLCEQGKTFEGAVPLGRLLRLTPLLASEQGEAAFVLAFDKDAEKRYRVQGHVRATLQLVCQRCVGHMSLEVDSSFSLALVGGPQEAEQLPEEYEPLMPEEETIRLLDLVEDELILAIPPAPRHSMDECPVKLDSVNQEQIESAAPAEEPEEKENPFAVLAALKRNNEHED